MQKDDPFGQALWDFIHGESGVYNIVRDDGYVDRENPAIYFFHFYKEEEEALKKYAHGKVLDIGCGPGRHATRLYEHGFFVVGFDIINYAVKIAKLHGLDYCVQGDAGFLPFKENTFDTVLLLGNGLGLLGTIDKTIGLLSRINRISKKDGVLIASSTDPENTDNPLHKKYHEENRKKNLPPGQLKIYIEYKGKRGKWFNLLLMDSKLAKELGEKSGWVAIDLFEPAPPHFVIVFRKCAS